MAVPLFRWQRRYVLDVSGVECDVRLVAHVQSSVDDHRVGDDAAIDLGHDVKARADPVKGTLERLLEGGLAQTREFREQFRRQLVGLSGSQETTT